MFKREIWGIPTGMWLVGVVYLALTALLRSYYVDYESLRQIAAVAEGFRRDSLGFWSGHAPLGMLLFWALTKPFALVFPLLESAQVLGAVAITLTGLILYLEWGLERLAHRAVLFLQCRAECGDDVQFCRDCPVFDGVVGKDRTSHAGTP
jgi:hypothetical protein